MDNKYSNANVPEAGEPFGDLGHMGKTWTLGEEQGISYRLDDEADEEEGDEDEDDEDFDEDDDEAGEEDEDDDAEEAEEAIAPQ